MKKVKKSSIITSLVVIIVVLAFGAFAYIMAYKKLESKISFEFLKDVNVEVEVKIGNNDPFVIKSTLQGFNDKSISYNNIVLSGEDEQTISMSFKNLNPDPVKVSFSELPDDSDYPSGARYNVVITYDGQTVDATEGITIEGSDDPETAIENYVVVRYSLTKLNSTFTINQSIKVTIENIIGESE